MYYFMLGVLPLPIPPKSLEIKTPSMNKTLTLINEGEINIPKKEGLREISFDFLLPTFQKYPFAMYQIGDYTAATIILYLKVWKKLRIPIPFIVVRMTPSGKFMYFTSILCLIEDVTYVEDAEEYGFDTNCSITLKEYNPYGTKRVEYNKSTNTATLQNKRSTADRQKKSEIKPKEGETLVSAAKREGYNPNDVLEANGIKTSNADGWLAELETMDPSEEIPDGMSASEYMASQAPDDWGYAVKMAKGRESLETLVKDNVWDDGGMLHDKASLFEDMCGSVVGKTYQAPVQSPVSLPMPPEAGGIPSFVMDAYSGIPAF